MAHVKSYISQDLIIDELTIRGVSLAGVGTSLYFPQFKVCMDVAQGLPFAVPAQKFFITHAHQDHAGGIPYLISQKALAGLPPAEFYVTPNMVDSLHTIMQEWIKIENHEYHYKFIGAHPGQRFEVGKDIFVEPFTTTHRIVSQGYTIIQQKKKLKPEYSQLTGQEIYKLKQEGVDVDDFIDLPLVSFTGDTTIDFLEKSPAVKNSKVLILEVTYIDEKKSVQSAREWGHIHLDELLECWQSLKNEHIVLMHLSGRHNSNQLEQILDRRIPKSDRSRFLVFPQDKMISSTS